MDVMALVVSTGVVALAEIGDKTQLLSLVLAARFGRPWPIVAGILVATLFNHGAAGALGAGLLALVGPQGMRWVLGLSFLAMAAWILVPDRLDGDGEAPPPRHGVFLTTVVLFFLAEIGDKTQVATVALAARYDALVSVVVGTTFGMMLANVPVVFFGGALAKRVPLSWVRRVTALVFVGLGVGVLVAPAG